MHATFDFSLTIYKNLKASTRSDTRLVMMSTLCWPRRTLGYCLGKVAVGVFKQIQAAALSLAERLPPIFD